MVIDVSDLEFRWQPNSPTVLSIDALQVPIGERLFIKGPSGSGKSTLLSLLSGVTTAVDGSVRVMDQVLEQLGSVQRDHFRYHLARIFVDDALQVPIRFAAYTWPENAGDPPQLEEEYTYRQLQFNVGYSDADFDLTVTATATDGSDTATTTDSIHVTVAADADAPTLSVSDASGTEDTAIALDITSALTDVDGSESLEITISGVPTGASLSAGTDNGDGSWTLTSGQLSGLSVTPAADSDAPELRLH